MKITRLAVYDVRIKGSGQSVGCVDYTNPEDLVKQVIKHELITPKPEDTIIVGATVFGQYRDGGRETVLGDVVIAEYPASQFLTAPLQ